MMCGGTGSLTQADADVQALCDLIKADCEGKAGATFEEFTAIVYTSQVVAGVNYFVKVHTGQEKFVHVRIYKPLPGQGDPSLHSVQHDKSRDDQVAYF